jgi:hypothetical protein
MLMCSCFAFSHHMSIDGGWTEWGTWSSCSLTCGGGVRSQSRTCTNPRPSVSGSNCDGKDMKVTPCNTGSCGMYATFIITSYVYVRSRIEIFYRNVEIMKELCKSNAEMCKFTGE